MRKLIVEFMLFFLAITYMYAGYTVAVSGNLTYYNAPKVSKTELMLKSGKINLVETERNNQ